MRVLVCGGRNYNDEATLCYVLDNAGTIGVLIHGNARGADLLADAWAKRRGIVVEVFPADWTRHGAGAGPIRNKQMLVEGTPDRVIAFPGGKGTADMVRRAKKAGIPVQEVPGFNPIGASPR